MAIRDNGGAGELIRKSSDAIGLNSIKLILKKSPSMFTSTGYFSRNKTMHFYL